MNWRRKTYETHECQVKQMILLNNHEFVNEQGKCVISEKKIKACFADKDLSSWTGLGRSGLALAGLDKSKMQLFIKFRAFRVWK